MNKKELLKQLDNAVFGKKKLFFNFFTRESDEVRENGLIDDIDNLKYRQNKVETQLNNLSLNVVRLIKHLGLEFYEEPAKDKEIKIRKILKK